MSLSRFDAFSEVGADLAGEDACARIVAYLFQRGRGHRISPVRMAAELGLEESVVRELLDLAASPGIALLEPAWQIRCPYCGERIDRAPPLAEERGDGAASCPECHEPIANLAGIAAELRYRLADDADAEVAARQAAEQAKPVMTVVILSALLVEFQAIHAQMKASGEVGQEVIAGGDIFLGGTLTGEHVTWRVRAACSEQSNTEAAATLTNAINSVKPDLALFVGVAGGIAGKVELGDVVAATTVFDYEPGKETAAGYEPRERQLESALNLRQAALHVALAARWPERIQPPEDDPTATHAAHVEPIAAGSKVVAATASPTSELIAKIAPRAVAVETEGAGFLVAVRRFPNVSAIVVRGISDMLDDKRVRDAQGSQPRAAARAAAFAFELISRFQPPPR